MVAFTVADFHDLVILLDKNPDWQRELRRLTLSDEVLALPEQLHALAVAEALVDERLASMLAAQERNHQQYLANAAASEARFAELRAADERLAEQIAAATARADAQFAELRAADERLAEQIAAATARADAQFAAAQTRADAQFAELREADQRLAGRIDALASDLHQFQRQTENRLANLDGTSLEQQFALRAPAHLGNIGLRRTHVIPTADWVANIEDAVDAGLLDENEAKDVRSLDAVVHARDAAGDVWLAVELSVTVDVHDVDRAIRRAVLLSRALGRSRPMVAGVRLTDGAKKRLDSNPDSLYVRWPASG